MDKNNFRVLAAGFIVITAGCNLAQKSTQVADCENHNFSARATQIEYPDVQLACHSQGLSTLPPRSLDDAPPEVYRELTLDEAIQVALRNSQVMKDLGGSVLNAADTTSSIYDPAIRESDPLFGTEAALSAFDAQFTSGIFWAQNDRAVNNITLGGGTRDINQDLGNFTSELSKTTATGTRFAVRNLTQYDQSNQPGNRFTSGWDTQWEAEARHPLLQGSGVTFNRIAGPNAQPGFNFSNGVMIARINTDISLADFETGVRDFVSRVEDSYWDLYLAYQTLEANIVARDNALKTWQSITAQKGLPGGTAEREARARVQYYAFQDLVHDALNGNPRSGQTVGVYRGERQLRLLMGLPANDGEMIRPADTPTQAKIVFDWYEALDEAMVRRVELRRQKWKIKRSEMELIAARNFRLPRLDAVAQYRMRGFGDQLTGGGPPNSSAFQDLGSGDHQEWQVGFELNVPVGFRQAWAGIRQAELQVNRDRAILREQELIVSHGLGDAVSEVSRAHASVRTNYNRLDAANHRVAAAQEVLKVDRVSVDDVLEAQQEVARAQTRFYEALIQYSIALKNVQLQKGTLLSMRGIRLSEGGWPNKAYGDAKELRNRLRIKANDYRFDSPGVISRGPYAQQAAISGGSHMSTSVSPTENSAASNSSEHPVTQQASLFTVDLQDAVTMIDGSTAR
ncbi:Outer membrane efflux protein [Rosistilla ulvae]|uniref:Outer membrane efflux protein n=1 Tax=Rosistilla ulvae TaxID=1930277 RepID=A0A517LYW2_9BACT|nr:TolC family protein [Rosistilla ulvae]QDS87798.1 Outer membrane efflux protein [Rosistilla ulvae]